VAKSVTTESEATGNLFGLCVESVAECDAQESAIKKNDMYLNIMVYYPLLVLAWSSLVGLIMTCNASKKKQIISILTSKKICQ
jgi:hypothetical protein